MCNKNIFQSHLNKTYLRPYAERRAQNAFEENMQIVRKHNILAKHGQEKYHLAAGQMADLVSALLSTFQVLLLQILLLI